MKKRGIEYKSVEISAHPSNIKTESERPRNERNNDCIPDFQPNTYLCVYMGFTRADIQITISNMHQQNIVIALISIVFLTHASETTTKTTNLYTFSPVSIHTNRAPLARLSFFFHFSTI